MSEETKIVQIQIVKTGDPEAQPMEDRQMNEATTEHTVEIVEEIKQLNTDEPLVEDSAPATEELPAEESKATDTETASPEPEPEQPMIKYSDVRVRVTQPSQMFTPAGPPPVDVLRHAKKILEDKSDQRTKVVRGKPITIFKNNSKLASLLASNKIDTKVPDVYQELVQFLLQYGGLILTTDDERKHVFDQEQSNAIISAAGEHQTPGFGYNRRVRLLTLLGEPVPPDCAEDLKIEYIERATEPETKPEPEQEEETSAGGSKSLGSDDLSDDIFNDEIVREARERAKAQAKKAASAMPKALLDSMAKQVVADQSPKERRRLFIKARIEQQVARQIESRPAPLLVKAEEPPIVKPEPDEQPLLFKLQQEKAELEQELKRVKHELARKPKAAKPAAHDPATAELAAAVKTVAESTDHRVQTTLQAMLCIVRNVTALALERLEQPADKPPCSPATTTEAKPDAKELSWTREITAVEERVEQLMHGLLKLREAKFQAGKSLADLESATGSTGLDELSKLLIGFSETEKHQLERTIEQAKANAAKLREYVDLLEQRCEPLESALSEMTERLEALKLCQQPLPALGQEMFAVPEPPFELKEAEPVLKLDNHEQSAEPMPRLEIKEPIAETAETVEPPPAHESWLEVDRTKLSAQEQLMLAAFMFLKQAQTAKRVISALADSGHNMIRSQKDRDSMMAACFQLSKYEPALLEERGMVFNRHPLFQIAGNLHLPWASKLLSEKMLQKFMAKF